ncbi:MAG: 2OG-Fe(II) oxygenase [Parvibaculum sp.]|nr:2OG-Fe(II) oxygenase [Parvibaculum sp.]
MEPAPEATACPNTETDIESRVDACAWDRITLDLDTRGYATIENLLAPDESAALAAFYADESIFRSRVVMGRHGFGRGEYKYFSYPLPDFVFRLRTSIYPRLQPVANDWNKATGIETRYPARHVDFLARCHAADQVRPTPLMLKYGPGDYNCLHQDLYGEHVFPLQLAILLSEPGRDFTGGEFVLTEQRPRMQSRAEVVPLKQGDAVIFAVHHRPVQGTRGTYKVNLRHGVSPLRSGYRQTLGVIFHDAT